MVGYYLAPTDATIINIVIVDISQLPSGINLLVDGDLNMDLDVPKRNDWYKAITK